MEENKSAISQNNSQHNEVPKNFKPWLWKPGQSGNPSGRPKGTLKDYVRRKFMQMSDEEKEEWVKSNKIPAIDQWKMAEGNPAQDNKIEHSGEIRTSTPLPLEAIAIIEEDLKNKKTENDEL